MSYASVYDERIILIDGFFYSGIQLKDFDRFDDGKLLTTNLAFFLGGVEARVGPAISEGGIQYILQHYFLVGLYIPMNHLRRISNPQNELIDLRDALGRLEESTRRIKEGGQYYSVGRRTSPERQIV